jgi:hypothetical protein
MPSRAAEAARLDDSAEHLQGIQTIHAAPCHSLYDDRKL